MPKVAIDLRATEVGFKQHALRGTGRYVKELYKELKENKELSIVDLYSKDFLKLPSSIPMIGRTTIETQLLLPRKINNLELDLAHFFSHGDAPAWGKAPTVVTVLDLIPLIFSDLYTKNKSNLRFKFARFLENNAVKKAKGIIAISEATKRDVVKILKVREDKIFVAPLAVSQDFIERKPKPEKKNKFEYPTLLYVGGIDARKNISFLLKVFKSLLKEKTWKTLPRLLIAGNLKQDANYEEFLTELKRHSLEQQVDELGYVSDDELIALYDSVDIFVFPSLYEGFGLPVLEAISRGCVVAAGNNSSIPEVLGPDYPLLEDNNEKEWIEYIYDLLRNEARKEKLSKIGIERSKIFSWKDTANKTFNAYKNILGSSQLAGGN